MHQSVVDKWVPCGFGASAEENECPYDPQTIYSQDPAIRRAVDALKEGPFATKAYERGSFSKLHDYLIKRDPYRILKDLRPYYEIQKKAEALFLQPNIWAETALHNIAAMGSFSADVAIRNYAEKIWGIEPCPPDPEILEKVRREYSENDRCRISNNQK